MKLASRSWLLFPWGEAMASLIQLLLASYISTGPTCSDKICHQACAAQACHIYQQHKLVPARKVVQLLLLPVIQPLAFVRT